MENTPTPLVLPAKTPRPIKLWAKKFLILSIYGLISGALTVGVITAAYLAITRTFDAWSTNYSYTSTGSGTQQTIWMVTLYLFAVLFGVITAIGLPIFWGKAGGFRRVFLIIFLEAFYVAVALLISSFFFFKITPPPSQPYPGCPSPVYNPGTVNGAICPAGPLNSSNNTTSL